MINVIWVGMLVVGVLVGGIYGRAEQITAAALQAAEAAVGLSLKLIGVMSLWLGIMKIADKSGVIRFCTYLIRPLTRCLFPSVPRDHPALGAIMMLLSANALGLGNAATPMGLKAMQELQKINHEKDTASEAMCTLLALTTAGFTLIPATVIALRSAAGSVNPTEIVATTLLASLAANTSVIICDKCCHGIAAGGEGFNMLKLVEMAAAWAIPAILLIVPLMGYIRRVQVYEVFVEGAAEGFQTSIRIMPFLIAMMVAIAVFKASGAMDAVIACLKPLLLMLNIPAELVPLAVMRPLSGTGALGITTDILQAYGPDTLVGRTASTILASTDTTLYILTVYFGSVGIKKRPATQ